MPSSVSLCPPIDETILKPSAQARILYADTDLMRIVYHASYFRYLELARGELLGRAALPSGELQRADMGLPLIDAGVQFVSPGRYDDLITIETGISVLSRVRVHFQYRVLVRAGDRAATEATVVLVRAETRHCCVRLTTGRPERMPMSVFDRLSAVFGETRRR